MGGGERKQPFLLLCTLDCLPGYASLKDAASLYLEGSEARSPGLEYVLPE